MPVDNVSWRAVVGHFYNIRYKFCSIARYFIPNLTSIVGNNFEFICSFLIKLLLLCQLWFGIFSGISNLNNYSFVSVFTIYTFLIHLINLKCFYFILEISGPNVSKQHNQQPNPSRNFSCTDDKTIENPVRLLIIISSYITTLLLVSGDICPNPGPIQSSQNTEFQILFNNINSITANKGSRFEQLKQYVNSPDLNIKIIALVEVGNIEGKTDDYKIRGFELIWYDPENRGLLYVHDSVKYKTVKRLKSNILHNIWLEVDLLYTKFRYCFVYRSPNQKPADRNVFLNELKVNLQNASANFQGCIFTNWDLNARNDIWYESDINNTAGIHLYKILTDLGLNQLVCEETRVAKRQGLITKSCIDHFV